MGQGAVRMQDKDDGHCGVLKRELTSPESMAGRRRGSVSVGLKRQVVSGRVEVAQLVRGDAAGQAVSLAGRGRG